MKKAIAALSIAGGLVVLSLTAIVSPSPEVATTTKDAEIDLKHATWDRDTMMGLDCWVDSGGRTYKCKADGPPTLPDYCQIYVTYTCGCEEMYDKVCNDHAPMSIRWDNDTLYIDDYGDLYTIKQCGGLIFGDVILFPDGTTLPAEACPKSSPKNATIVDDRWRTFDAGHYTMDRSGTCWTLDGSVWKCEDSEGDCQVKFTDTWLGATHTFYASCKENNPMRLWNDAAGDWCIADWDRYLFLLKKDQ